jgi:hypothetical protein
LRVWMSDKADKGENAAAPAKEAEPGAVDSGNEEPPSPDEMNIALPDHIVAGDWGIHVSVYEAKEFKSKDPNGCCASVTVKC